MVSLRVYELKNDLPTVQRLRELFTGAGWRFLMEAIGKDMADQVRRNMLKHGGPGGDWPKLSGYGVASKEIRKTRKKEGEKAVTSKHSGYARQIGRAHV